MKKMKPSALIAGIAILMANSSCMETNLYDPDKVRDIPPAENPVDAGFSAPEGFDWSMLRNVNLTVKVTDEANYNGCYSLVEIFTRSPQGNPGTAPVMAGKAKAGEDFTARNLTFPKATTKLYIRKTDPRNHREIFEFPVSENMICPLYITGGKSSRAASAHTRAGAPEIAVAEVPAIPSDAVKVESGAAWVNMESGKSYLISNVKDANVYLNGTSDLYVDGDCDIAQVGNGNLIIMPGASLKVNNNIGLYEGCHLYNFGTLSAPQIWNNPGFTLYNRGEINISGYLALGDNAGLTNEGGIKAANIKSGTNSTLTNAQGASIEVSETFQIDTSTLHNSGSIKALNDASQTNWDGSVTYSKSIQTNATTGVVINNYEGGIIESSQINGAAINNYGTLIARQIDSKESDNSLYNACTIVVTERFNYREVVLDNGSITGGQTSDGHWNGVKAFMTNNQANILLKNSSVIIADKIIGGNPMKLSGEGTGESISLIMAGEVQYMGDTEMSGLALKYGEEYFDADKKPVEGHTNKVDKSNCVIIEGEPKYTIETCGSIIIEGAPGTEPEDPVVPDTEPVSESNQLTYAFEDNWPVYGDLDMNDAVVSLHKLSATTEDGACTFTLRGRVQAVGASRSVGLGIRLMTGKDGIAGNLSDGIELEAGQSNPVFIISTDLHSYMGQAGSRPFINTETTGDCVNVSPRTFEIKLNFSTLEKAQNAAKVQNVDVFIFSPSKNHRREIHVPGFAPTDLADRTYLGTGNDDSLDKAYYLSNEGLAWGVCVPSGSKVWSWPTEWTSICNAYPLFKEWVTSGGTKNAGWYEAPQGNKTYQ